MPRWIAEVNESSDGVFSSYILRRSQPNIVCTHQLRILESQFLVMTPTQKARSGMFSAFFYFAYFGGPCCDVGGG
jgi:hypothetical protein